MLIILDSKLFIPERYTLSVSVRLFFYNRLCEKVAQKERVASTPLARCTEIQDLHEELSSNDIFYIRFLYRQALQISITNK